MRFAWLQEQSAASKQAEQGTSNRLILTGYNLIWWIPIILPFLNVIDYGTGFIAFAAITVLRAAANLYRNNVLPLEQAVRFPFRSP